MIWLLIIVNMSGGEPAQVYFDDEVLCEAAAEEVDAMPYTNAVCVYAGTDGQ